MCNLTSTFNATFLYKLLYTVQLQMLTFGLWSCYHVSMLHFERKELMILHNPNILGLWRWFAHIALLITIKSGETISLYIRILSILTELNHTCQHTNGKQKYFYHMFEQTTVFKNYKQHKIRAWSAALLVFFSEWSCCSEAQWSKLGHSWGSSRKMEITCLIFIKYYHKILI